MTLTNLAKAPFPWFGGKSQAADLVWQLLGDVDHFAEPFAGALGVLLNRPHPCNRSYFSETINDLDGFVVNAWRAIQQHPEATAEHASWPVSEADKTARQIGCLKWRTDTQLERLAADPDWCDPKIAGWWLWAVCVQIGAFNGRGPWTADPVTGRITKQPHPGTREPGVARDLPHLGDDGRGVNHANTREPGVARDLPQITDGGRGVNHANTREPGVSRLDAMDVSNPDGFHPITMPELVRWFRFLAARLRHVRILNGDWSRLCTSGALRTLSVRQGGHVGVFLDPPYHNNERASGLYGHDDGDVTHAVRDWCIANGDRSDYRIVLAGYDNEHTELEDHGWSVHEWFTAGYLTGGMANIGDDAHQQHRERLWASPHCLTPGEIPNQLGLFDD